MDTNTQTDALKTVQDLLTSRPVWREESCLTNSPFPTYRWYRGGATGYTADLADGSSLTVVEIISHDFPLRNHYLVEVTQRGSDSPEVAWRGARPNAGSASVARLFKSAKTFIEGAQRSNRAAQIDL